MFQRFLKNKREAYISENECGDSEVRQSMSHVPKYLDDASPLLWETWKKEMKRKWYFEES